MRTCEASAFGLMPSGSSVAPKGARFGLRGLPALTRWANEFRRFAAGLCRDFDPGNWIGSTEFISPASEIEGAERDSCALVRFVVEIRIPPAGMDYASLS